MPAYLRDDDVVALKWVAGYPANKERGLPYISGLIVLNDAETGLAVAVMDGAEITATRTAAASGVCVRGFAPDGWRDARSSGAASRGASTPGSWPSSTRTSASAPTTLIPTGSSASWRSRPRRPLPGRARRSRAPRSWSRPGRSSTTLELPARTRVLGDRYLALPIDFDFYFGAEAVVERPASSSSTTWSSSSYYRLARPLPGLARAGRRASAKALGAGTAYRRRWSAAKLGIGALDAAFAAVVLERRAPRAAASSSPTRRERRS